MGILTDYFIATRAEAQDMDADALPISRFDCAQLKGVDSVVLAQLDVLVRELPFTEAVDASELIHMASEEGPWVLSVPHELVERLAKMPDAETASLATRWIQCEELQGWTTEDAIFVLNQLRRLASKAVSSNKEMFLWVSL